LRIKMKNFPLYLKPSGKTKEKIKENG